MNYLKTTNILVIFSMLSAGFQFSNPDSKTPEALVLEFTYVPSASQYHLIHKHGH
jgi:hypothetical protein